MKGGADENPFSPADVAGRIRTFILDYFAYELGAALAKPVKRVVDVVNREHDAEVAYQQDVACDQGGSRPIRIPREFDVMISPHRLKPCCQDIFPSSLFGQSDHVGTFQPQPPHCRVALRQIRGIRPR